MLLVRVFAVALLANKSAAVTAAVETPSSVVGTFNLARNRRVPAPSGHAKLKGHAVHVCEHSAFYWSGEFEVVQCVVGIKAFGWRSLYNARVCVCVCVCVCKHLFCLLFCCCCYYCFVWYNDFALRSLPTGQPENCAQVAKALCKTIVSHFTTYVHGCMQIYNVGKIFGANHF